MLSKLSSLPGPLKAVVWLNIVVALYTAIVGVATLTSEPYSSVLINLGTAVISGLVVIGILQKSRMIRMLILCFAWLGMVVSGVSLVIAVYLNGLFGVVAIMPLGLNVLTVWGLRAASTKVYFGIGGATGAAHPPPAGPAVAIMGEEP